MNFGETAFSEVTFAGLRQIAALVPIAPFPSFNQRFLFPEVYQKLPSVAGGATISFPLLGPWQPGTMGPRYPMPEAWQLLPRVSDNFGKVVFVKTLFPASINQNYLPYFQVRVHGAATPGVRAFLLTTYWP